MYHFHRLTKPVLKIYFCLLKSSWINSEDFLFTSLNFSWYLPNLNVSIRLPERKTWVHIPKCISTALESSAGVLYSKSFHLTLGIVLGDVRLACSCSAMLPAFSFCAGVTARGQNSAVFESVGDLRTLCLSAGAEYFRFSIKQLTADRGIQRREDFSGIAWNHITTHIFLSSLEWAILQMLGMLHIICLHDFFYTSDNASK